MNDNQVDSCMQSFFPVINFCMICTWDVNPFFKLLLVLPDYRYVVAVL